MHCYIAIDYVVHENYIRSLKQYAYSEEDTHSHLQQEGT